MRDRQQSVFLYLHAAAGEREQTGKHTTQPAIGVDQYPNYIVLACLRRVSDSRA